MSKCEISSIDHIVLTVVDISKTIDFYCLVLGTKMVNFAPPTGGAARKSLHFGKQKINLHDAASPYLLTLRPRKLQADLCLISTSRLMIGRRIHRHGVTVEEGPVRKVGRTAAHVTLYPRPRWQSNRNFKLYLIVIQRPEIRARRVQVGRPWLALLCAVIFGRRVVTFVLNMPIAAYREHQI